MDKKYGDLSNLKFISRLNKRCILNEGRLEEYERELGVKFPESDREYIKSFMGTHPFNLCIDIKLENGEIIERRINTFAPLGKFYKDKLIQDIQKEQKEYLKEIIKEFVDPLENIKNILSDKKIIPIAILQNSYLYLGDCGYGSVTKFCYNKFLNGEINKLEEDYTIGIKFYGFGVIGYDYRDGNCKVVYIDEHRVIELGKSIVELKNMIYTSSEEKDNENKEEYIKRYMGYKLYNDGYGDNISTDNLYYDYEDTAEEIEEVEKELGIKFPKKFKELRALGLKRIKNYDIENYEDGDMVLMEELSVKNMVKNYRDLYKKSDEYVKRMIEEWDEEPEVLPPKLIPLYEIIYDIYYDDYYRIECLYYHDGVPEDEPEVVMIEGFNADWDLEKLADTYEEYLEEYLEEPDLDIEKAKKEAKIYGENIYNINIGENLRRYKVEKKEEYKRRERKDISIELLSEREKLKGKEFCKIVNNGIVMDNVGKYEENVIEDIGEIELYKLSKLMEYEQIEEDDEGLEVKQVLEICNRLSEKYGYEPVYIIEGEKVKIKELSKDEGVKIEEADYRDTEGFRIAPIYYRISGDKIEKERDLIKEELKERYLENLEEKLELYEDDDYDEDDYDEDLYICRTVSEDE